MFSFSVSEVTLVRRGSSFVFLKLQYGFSFRFSKKGIRHARHGTARRQEAEAGGRKLLQTISHFVFHELVFRSGSSHIFLFSE